MIADILIKLDRTIYRIEGVDNLTEAVLWFGIPFLIVFGLTIFVIARIFR